MKKLHAVIPALILFLPILLSADTPDVSLYEIFQDEQFLTVEHEPYEPQPASVRLFDDSSEAMKSLFQPAILMQTLLLQSGRKTREDEMGFETISFSTPVIPSPAQVVKRAQEFERSGLNALAQDEYAYLLELDPKNKSAQAAAENLKRREKQQKQAQKARGQVDALVKRDLQEGINYFEHNQFDEAVAAFVRVLNIDPSNEEAAAYIKKIGDHAR